MENQLENKLENNRIMENQQESQMKHQMEITVSTHQAADPVGALWRVLGTLNPKP